MSEGVRQKKHHYPWPIGFVQQPLSSSNLCPYQTTEVPDEQTIKDAFMQAFQRGWYFISNSSVNRFFLFSGPHLTLSPSLIFTTKPSNIIFGNMNSC